MKKATSVFMAIVLLLSVFAFETISNAKNENASEVMPRFASISSYSTNLDISGLKASIAVSLVPIYTTNLKIVVQLQKETSTGYEDVETWTATKASGVYLSITESKIINPFNDYRLRVTFTADKESIVVFKYP